MVRRMRWRASLPLRSLLGRCSHMSGGASIRKCKEVAGQAYLPSVFVREVCVFLRLGWGMRHSMEKAVQLVHGMPSEAASQRTCIAVMRWPSVAAGCGLSTHLPGMASCDSWWLAFVFESDRGAEARGHVDIRHAHLDCASTVAARRRAKEGETYFHTLCWRAAGGTKGGQGEPTVNWRRACTV